MSDTTPPQVADHPDSLDIIPAAVWLYDPLAHQLAWGNRAALALWGVADLSALRTKDLSDTRQQTRDRLQRMLARLWTERQITKTWTLYPNEIGRAHV